MKVTFVDADPRAKGRPILDNVLEQGVDQIAIACAFLTGGGARVLSRHAAKLKLPESFLVVAWERPTSLEALQDLHALIPGHLYHHLGALTPVERGGLLPRNGTTLKVRVSAILSFEGARNGTEGLHA